MKTLGNTTWDGQLIPKETILLCQFGLLRHAAKSALADLERYAPHRLGTIGVLKTALLESEPDPPPKK